jgi:hypothetical protein
MIGLLLAAYFLTTPLRVLIESRIQHNIQSISRATITSVIAFITALFGILFTSIFGLISLIWNLQSIYTATAIILILFSAWVLVMRNTLAAKAENSQ